MTETHLRDNRSYYDEFSSWYERERDHGYHALVDRLELDALAPFLPGARVLEAGCGTGLLLSRARRGARLALGVDLSRGMLGHAKGKGLGVAQASVERLPFTDHAFDVVYSFKVLAHIEPIEAALAELSRVTRPGGKLVLEFYNAHSLRRVVRLLRPGLQISDRTTDAEVYTRFDTLADVRRALPAGVRITGVRGVRVLTLLPQLLDVPIAGQALAAAERAAAGLPVLRRLGGFMVVIAEKAR